MTENYFPNITEAIYPSDGGWTTNNNENILLLSLPEINESISISIDTFDYTWIFDEKLEAYIFCFRINKEVEHAILFQKNHAGRLLMEEEADQNFTIALTSTAFEEMTEQTPILYLLKIQLKRYGEAGW